MIEKDFNTSYKPSWCPGCGNFGIFIALKNALVELNIKPENVLLVAGVGCSGNGVNFLKAYGWHSLHGRALPTAVGAKLANKDLTVIVMAGDGDGYGEGMAHFIHAVRGNTNITYITHDNQLYALTTGQAAPTTDKGTQTKSTPGGLIEEKANPITLALSSGGSFVARGFSGDATHLKELLKKAILHQGFSLVDVFQPCVTFNKVNTFKYFFDRLYNLDKKEGYTTNDVLAAYKEAMVWGDKIAYGLFYEDKRPSYDKYLPQLNGPALVKRPMKVRNIEQLLKEFA
ncbi:MAG: 2-oxoacid ferredoxin oxidoreductase [Candidatus Komeilibacteria bacterium RIFOXYC1_FULL_37_11]|uniref:2-oxoacid ferredoxin oxidoreductase n=1 Tax=Candidatus Komeilibacteria bacterium RIFOXYC1_FULL_37_11 TaxID=1798555 RepID=A0A1G2BY81_9BACT|nr:MAG: 2-oxoacid ferredoxin oxidoreductase [Candidatus Komeilibacteria bacterium RIFOXYC1_FULL_37_11]OGY96010.1 MAG: 2-oxoacid ferredoxin oxidoreductase [Candidatus Komeilibacteria bacterium RIFOXYD1_FULL_37_29]OGY96871.1 MAG: 2-oxoacid ferredoxin oxidoreductase [Candidatus Komeilibacteria bacterium RIFOXYD2_FULL_37_8]